MFTDREEGPHTEGDLNTNDCDIRLACLSMAVQTYEKGDDVLDIAQDMYEFVKGVRIVEGPHLVKG